MAGSGFFAFFSLLAGISLCVNSASARTYDVEERAPLASILTYDELSQLKADERIQYVRKLRLILAETEVLQQEVGPQASHWEGFFPRLFPPVLHLWSGQVAHSQSSYPCLYGDGKLQKLQQTLSEEECRALREKARFAKERMGTLQDKGERSAISNVRSTRDSLQNTSVSSGESFQSGSSKLNSVKRPVAGSSSKISSSKMNQSVPKPKPKPKNISNDSSCQDNTKADSALSCKPRCRDRAAFYKSRQSKESAACLMGGNFTEYANNQVKAGNCQKVTSLQVGQAELSCSDGKNLCNPLLYCGGGSSGAQEILCLKVSEDFTKSCEQATQNRKCDPMQISGMNSKISKEDVKKAWDEFAAKQVELCQADAEFVRFFCDECNMMNERVKKLYQEYQPKIQKNRSPLQVPSGASTTGVG